MAKTKDGLVSFSDYLTDNPAPGSNAPPRSIKASDLDDNFKRVTLIAPTDPEKPQAYSVKITDDGTEIVFGNTQTLIVAINGKLYSVPFVTGGDLTPL